MMCVQENVCSCEGEWCQVGEIVGACKQKLRHLTSCAGHDVLVLLLLASKMRRQHGRAQGLTRQEGWAV